jgi:Nucleotidyltransferase domain
MVAMTGDGNTHSGTVLAVSNPAIDVPTALGTYLEIADSVHPGLVEGLYVVGSFALDDWVPGASDIDVVVVTAEPATDDDYGSLRTVHALLRAQQPMPHIDGPYLAWGDLVVEPATGLHRPWTLHGEPHHDGDCFEINPITWYTLATHGVTVRGPAPSTLGIPTDVEARIRFVVDNLQTYWSNLADDVAAVCMREPDRGFDAESFVWCALGSLRLHYTAFTGDVTSKRSAGTHGLRLAPERFHPMLHAALEMRAAGEVGEVQPLYMADTAELIRWVVDDVLAAS